MVTFPVDPLMKCIFLHIRFARECSHVADFNARNKCLFTNVSNRDIGIISLERLFSSFIVGIMNWFQKTMSD